MGWFENQIEERRRTDQQLLEDAFLKISGVVMGESGAQKIIDEHIVTKGAIDEILKYYHYKPVEVPGEIKDMDAQLDYCLRPYGLMRRTIRLSKNWFKDAYGPILALTREDSLPVALLPGKMNGYTFRNPKTGARERVRAGNAGDFEAEAICFYRPLPQKSLKIPDLLIYMRRSIDFSDSVAVCLAAAAISLTGLIMPQITRALTGPVLSSGQAGALICIAICIICVSLSTQLLSGIRNMLQARLSTKTSMAVQSAMMMRLLALPAGFFRMYSPGELRTRSASVGQLCSMMMGMITGTALMSLTSLIYIGQILRFTPTLVIPSVIIVVTTVVVSMITTYVQIGINRKKMELSAKESGMTFSLISGIQKIKLSGAEKRVFAKWLDLYSDSARLTYNPPMFIKVNGVVTMAISLISTIVLYYLAIVSNIGQSDYFAFMAAYGMLMGAFMSVSNIAITAAQIRPVLEMAEPFLKAEPETALNKEIVTHISGSIELDHVSFRYDENGPLILKDLSLKIRPGEYIAVVGKSGCGKSTLVRLLLGFEKPEKGVIYYDGKSMDSLDLPSLRRKIGTVMQDSGLFQGDIFGNIVISAPELTMADAWEAAETAGIADDIRAMPMGMHTVVSEGQGGISGGQRQRLMIARAIAPKPKLLIFDEATSALDNKTQRQVSEALDNMGCTRLVIAHRLSTIRHCDRILVMDSGRIIEDGTYDALIEKGGFFAGLVERQRLETTGG